MSPENVQSSIQLTLNGLFTVFVDPTNRLCTVGLLRKTPPHHALKISISKAVRGGPFVEFAEINEADIEDQLSLTVSNTSREGISRRKMDAKIDRKNGATPDDKDSFRWVVDFESDLYPVAIGANKAGFRPILTVNNGELLARKLSTNKLLVRRGPDGIEEEFGVVACETGIDIVLDRPQSRAVFENGNGIVFESDPESSYKIRIDRGQLHSHPGGNDADFYYTALGTSIPDNDKIFFSSTRFPEGEPLPPNTPDAVCFNGGASKSQPV